MAREEPTLLAWFFYKIMTIAIIISFLVFISWREYTTTKHIKDLELKAFSKTPQEYAILKNADKPSKRIEPKEEDELVDPLDVNSNDAVKGMVK